MPALLLVDNLFSPVQYRDVVLSANEERSGHEIEFFSTLRREDSWSPTTFNADAWARASHTQPRAINMVCLWVHNLLGEAYKLQISNNGFTDIETIVDVTIPANPGAGDVDDANGVLAEDGLMWCKRITPTRYAYDFRHFVPAMGANQRPELAGMAGTVRAFERRRGELLDGNTVRGEEHRSDRGVTGSGTEDIARDGVVPVYFTSLFQWEEFRFHLQRYDGTATGARTPALLISDETRAEQAVLVRRPLGRMAFKQSTKESFYPSGELFYEEHDPREVA